MARTLALLHTTAVTVPAMKELAAEHLPGVRVINLLDDSLLQDVIAAGGVTPAVEERLRAYLDRAAVAGLLRRSDVVVLAQARMARLLGSLAAPPRVPILTSPLSGLRAAEAQLSALSAR